MIASQVLSAELAKITKWTTLYWWNCTPKKGWYLDSKQVKGTGSTSIPAYNFEFLFEKLRPVFKLQGDKELLQAFRLLLAAPNPAESLCKLAITLAQEGLIK